MGSEGTPTKPTGTCALTWCPLRVSAHNSTYPEDPPAVRRSKRSVRLKQKDSTFPHLLIPTLPLIPTTSSQGLPELFPPPAKAEFLLRLSPCLPGLAWLPVHSAPPPPSRRQHSRAERQLRIPRSYIASRDAPRPGRGRGVVCAVHQPDGTFTTQHVT